MLADTVGFLFPLHIAASFECWRSKWKNRAKYISYKLKEMISTTGISSLRGLKFQWSETIGQSLTVTILETFRGVLYNSFHILMNLKRCIMTEWFQVWRIWKCDNTEIFRNERLELWVSAHILMVEFVLLYGQGELAGSTFCGALWKALNKRALNDLESIFLAPLRYIIGIAMPGQVVWDVSKKKKKKKINFIVSFGTSRMWDIDAIFLALVYVAGGYSGLAVYCDNVQTGKTYPSVEILWRKHYNFIEE